MRIEGSCSCGNMKVEGEADENAVSVCHCTDCQTASGSAFRVAVPVPGTTFKVSGTPTIFIKTTAESGNPRAQAFCPQLGHRPRRHPQAREAGLTAFGKPRFALNHGRHSRT